MIYRILSLDGGGLRGLITAILLQRIEQATPGFLASVDLFVGTSTGGILALALAAGRSPQEIIDLYEQRGAMIFKDSLWDNIHDLGKTIGADYDNKDLKKGLQDVFGAKKLSQLGRKVAVPAFDLDNEAPSAAERSWSPKIFHNFTGSDSDGARLAADVALYTSSAPTYFPSADGYVDGGVFANNPSMVGVVQAMDTRNQPGERAELSDIRLFSVGTGVTPTFIKGARLDWGYAQWAKPLINLLMDGVSEVADFQCKQILGVDHYRRLQVVFGPNERVEMDDVKKLPRMREIAEAADITATATWVQTGFLA